ncbi:type II secretory pathway protein [Opitutaceae bacterium TAV4]|uniref:type II secretion system F family protein n=1 Tax=Geminisphaera colitermitum TaxID=1148786 RepID=UPI00019653E1|nr:type II secretion system F family protein [Geminisphaera colitermitum]RRJ95464.1 type II secretory pathway protein [Opitutaceae bacterium TAV4]RRK01132.1 type II secretory pathway protein [Opitutaceae bacterium TAV3]
MALSHKKISAWYLQLAQQLEAGLPLIAAIRGNAGAPKPDRDAMVRRLEDGMSFPDALDAAGPWLPRGDRLFLATASIAGRLPHTLRNLSSRHGQLAAASGRVVMACIYPVVILHVALLMFPLLRMLDWERGFQWDESAYLGSLAVTLLPLWALGVTGFVLAKRESPLWDRALSLLPIFRRYRREQALADFCFALGNLLDAGAPIGDAWIAAGRSSRSPALIAAARSIRDTVQGGGLPGTRLEEFSCFPDDFVTMYRTGETAGQLDSNMIRLAGLHQDYAGARLKMASLFYPGVVFGIVAVVVGYHVIRFILGYVDKLNSLM